MGRSMYVCLCKGINEKQINQGIAEGQSSLRALQEALGVGVDCGRCCEYIQEVLLIAEANNGAGGEPGKCSLARDVE